MTMPIQLQRLRKGRAGCSKERSTPTTLPGRPSCRRSADLFVGDWINRDPIGERGGINLYRAIGNDPVGNTDAYGEWVGPALIVCAAAATVGIMIYILAKNIEPTRDELERTRDQAGSADPDVTPPSSPDERIRDDFQRFADEVADTIRNTPNTPFEGPIRPRPRP